MTEAIASRSAVGQFVAGVPQHERMPSRPIRIIGKVRKRLWQLAYLCLHPVAHFRCVVAVRPSGGRHNWLVSSKYLGDYLALSMPLPQRMSALIAHYQMISAKVRPSHAEALADGVVIWSKDLQGGLPPLRIHLEPSRLAPMEGELQLRFSFRSDLFIFTFSFGTGAPFNIPARDILFIGGAQGALGSRLEMREASRLNDEISPASMLMMAVRALANAVNVEDLIAVCPDEQISQSYCPDGIRLDYHQYWSDAGGSRQGDHYHLPVEPVPKPLSEIPLTHRARTRRKREAKERLRASIAKHVGLIFRSGCLADARETPLSPSVVVR